MARAMQSGKAVVHSRWPTSAVWLLPPASHHRCCGLRDLFPKQPPQCADCLGLDLCLPFLLTPVS